VDNFSLEISIFGLGTYTRKQGRREFVLKGRYQTGQAFGSAMEKKQGIYRGESIVCLKGTYDEQTCIVDKTCYVLEDVLDQFLMSSFGAPSLRVNEAGVRQR